MSGPLLKATALRPARAMMLAQETVLGHIRSMSFADAVPARQARALRAIHPVRQESQNFSQNRQKGVQNSSSCFTCCAIGFNIHKPGIHVVSSFGGDGARAEELFEANNDNADSFLNDFSWDSYLGEVTTREKVEEPPQYVPPPPIAAEDICIRDKLETLFYTLEEVLPGQLDNHKAQALCSMLCATVEVQNPLNCFRGIDKCSEWLRTLMQVQASINVHELYTENDMEDPDKRRIYVVWTVNFFEHVRANATDLVENLSGSESNQLSGETMLEMEESGLVSRISSTWYVLQDDDGASFTRAKDALYRLIQRTF